MAKPVPTSNAASNAAAPVPAGSGGGPAPAKKSRPPAPGTSAAWPSGKPTAGTREAIANLHGAGKTPKQIVEALRQVGVRLTEPEVIRYLLARFPLPRQVSSAAATPSTPPSPTGAPTHDGFIPGPEARLRAGTGLTAAKIFFAVTAGIVVGGTVVAWVVFNYIL